MKISAQAVIRFINPNNWDYEEGFGALLTGFGFIAIYLAMIALVFALSHLIVFGLTDLFGRWGYLVIAVLIAIFGIWLCRIVRRA